ALGSGSLAQIDSIGAIPARIIPLINAVAILPDPMNPQRFMPSSLWNRLVQQPKNLTLAQATYDTCERRLTVERILIDPMEAPRFQQELRRVRPSEPGLDLLSIDRSC